MPPRTQLLLLAAAVAGSGALLVPARAFASTHRPTRHPPPRAAMPAITSRVFQPLGSPANYTATLEAAPADAVSVIKWQASYCRTCRKTSPLLDRAAKQWPKANFYSMDLYRNGRAAGERMNNFFKARNITMMPYVEVWLGNECVETEV